MVSLQVFTVVPLASIHSLVVPVNGNVCCHNNVYNLSKEVWKSNFRQYGQMKSRVWQRQREEKD